MDSVLFHHPLFPPFLTTTRHLTNYAPSKLAPISATKLPNITCRALGNIGGRENGSVFDIFVDFFVSDTDGDPDCPTDGFSSVEDSLATLRLGKVGNIGGSENGSVFDVFGTNAGENDNSKAFKIVDAEITPETVDFFVSDTDGDPDCLTDGFSCVEDADRY
nr:monofunctional riboflavin biosynthesis protein RIBA 3, chloroplastic [Tanacetum cinerariifolium]